MTSPTSASDVRAFRTTDGFRSVDTAGISQENLDKLAMLSANGLLSEGDLVTIVGRAIDTYYPGGSGTGLPQPDGAGDEAVPYIDIESILIRCQRDIAKAMREMKRQDMMQAVHERAKVLEQSESIKAKEMEAARKEFNGGLSRAIAGFVAAGAQGAGAGVSGFKLGKSARANETLIKGRDMKGLESAKREAPKLLAQEKARINDDAQLAESLKKKNTELEAESKAQDTISKARKQDLDKEDAPANGERFKKLLADDKAALHRKSACDHEIAQNKDLIKDLEDMAKLKAEYKTASANNDQAKMQELQSRAQPIQERLHNARTGLIKKKEEDFEAFDRKIDKEIEARQSQRLQLDHDAKHHLEVSRITTATGNALGQGATSSGGFGEGALAREAAEDRAEIKFEEAEKEAVVREIQLYMDTASNASSINDAMNRGQEQLASASAQLASKVWS